MNDPSRVCPRCNRIHDDIHEGGRKYAICNRCMDEIKDAYGDEGAAHLEEQYDFAADDHNFRAKREGR